MVHTDSKQETNLYNNPQVKEEKYPTLTMPRKIANMLDPKKLTTVQKTKYAHYTRSKT